MDAVSLIAIILAGIWGVMWAVFLQLSYQGRFLAARMTWLTVVIGVGVDLAIMLLMVPFETWLKVFGVIAASSIAIITRSLINEARDSKLLLELRDGRGKSADETPDSE